MCDTWDRCPKRVVGCGIGTGGVGETRGGRSVDGGKLKSLVGGFLKVSVSVRVLKIHSHWDTVVRFSYYWGGGSRIGTVSFGGRGFGL